MTATSSARRNHDGATGTAIHAASNRVAGNVVFFPLATAYAIVVVPASVLSMLGMVPAVPGLASPAGHAHELLFGFALAVVAGNQLGPRRRASLVILAGLWLLARAAFLGWPGSAAAHAANIAFPASLAAVLAPRLLASAKKWRNQSLPLTLMGICASAVGFAILSALRAAALERVLDVAVALFAMLLLFMGGRLIAPSVAGQLQRQGRVLAARVQPRIEGALIVVMAISVIALALGDAHAAFVRAAGVALILAALLAVLRMIRWHLWALRGRPDLVCLAAGYAWLALGLAAFGTGLATGAPPGARTGAIHVITVGSLGTLTLNVMAMTRLLRARLPAGSSRLPVYATLLLALATVLRVFAGPVADTRAMLLAAAACWSMAYVLLLVLLAITPIVAPAQSRSVG
ncbi:MAG: NnrS family protein [Burkholderiales bacterium]|nr:NnrS family protein [Burkholderiales bacterium]